MKLNSQRNHAIFLGCSLFLYYWRDMFIILKMSTWLISLENAPERYIVTKTIWTFIPLKFVHFLYVQSAPLILSTQKNQTDTFLCNLLFPFSRFLTPPPLITDQCQPILWLILEGFSLGGGAKVDLPPLRLFIRGICPLPPWAPPLRKEQT